MIYWSIDMTKTKFHTLIFVYLPFGVFISACTNQAAYNNLKHQQQLECNRLPSGSELDDCQAAVLGDYREYQQKRRELLEQEESL